MNTPTRRQLIQTGAGAFLGATCATAAPTHRNLLFIMTDQQRWDALTCAGNPYVSTPNLDRLAREGALFERAYTPCPVCVPARASILTGHSTQTTGIRSNRDIDRDDLITMPSFDQVLASNQYKTEYYGKWHTPIRLADCYQNPVTAAGVKLENRPGPGLSQHYRDWLDARVPDRPLKPGELRDNGWTHKPYCPDPLDIRYGLQEGDTPRDAQGKSIRVVQPDYYGCLDIPPECTHVAQVTDETIDALQRLKDGPFSITCSWHHPHAPMTLPRPWYGMVPPDEIPPPATIDDSMDNSPYAAIAQNMQRYRNPDTIGFMQSAYFGLINEIDAHVGKILDTLDTLGLTDNTLVVFTSDHGEMLGAHGMREKNVFYEESAHIPLIMRLPGEIPASITRTNPVTQVHLFNTILDYLQQPDTTAEGQSLRSLINDENADGFNTAVCEWGNRKVPNFMITDGTWKLMIAREPDSPNIDALYNLVEDPMELQNLIGRNPRRSQWLPRAEQLKEQLIAWLETTQSRFLEGVKTRTIT
jgi:arylsulfatase A-like enzyme